MHDTKTMSFTAVWELRGSFVDLFAVIMMFPTLELRIFFAIPIPAYIFGPLYLAFEFWSDKNSKSNIAHDAHISGAISGICVHFNY